MSAPMAFSTFSRTLRMAAPVEPLPVGMGIIAGNAADLYFLTVSEAASKTGSVTNIILVFSRASLSMSLPAACPSVSK